MHYRASVSLIGLVSLQDTAGQERFSGLSSFYCRDAKAAILAYDITSKDSFDALRYIDNISLTFNISDVSLHLPQSPCVSLSPPASPSVPLCLSQSPCVSLCLPVSLSVPCVCLSPLVSLSVSLCLPQAPVCVSQSPCVSVTSLGLFNLRLTSNIAILCCGWVILTGKLLCQR